MARKNKIQSRSDETMDTSALQDRVEREESTFLQVDEFQPDMKWHLTVLGLIGVVLILVYGIYFTFFVS